MKRISLAALLALIAFARFTPVLAHNGNEHIRGVVTAISATSLTVRVSEKSTKTLTINATTTFEKAGAPAHLADLMVGDKVVVDVPEKTSEARLIKFGTAPKKPVG